MFVESVFADLKMVQVARDGYSCTYSFPLTSYLAGFVAHVVLHMSVC